MRLAKIETSDPHLLENLSSNERARTKAVWKVLSEAKKEVVATVLSIAATTQYLQCVI